MVNWAEEWRPKDHFPKIVAEACPVLEK